MNDFLGQEIIQGDYISGLYPENETPAIFIVRGFTPMKVRLDPTTYNPEDKRTLKFPVDLIKLDAEAVEKILVQNPKDRLGQDLAIGDYAFASGGEYIDPVIVEITQFIADAAVVTKVYGDVYVRNDTRYTRDLIKVDPKIVTMFVLKKDNN